MPFIRKESSYKKNLRSVTGRSQHSLSKGCTPFLLSSHHRLGRCYVRGKYFLKIILNQPISKPKYTPLSLDSLSNILLPAWYKVEKANLITKLTTIGKVALTSESWTSHYQGHYLTVTAHYILKGEMRQKVQTTKAVYDAQTGPVVAE